MKLKFWGVRGSIPTPLTPEQVQRKISSVVQRIRPQDIRDSDSREAFLTRLPPSLFGTAGGNTSCIEIRLRDNTCILLDAGSGITQMGAALNEYGNRVREFHLFISHYHWDHLQGLPLFGLAYQKGCAIRFYSPDEHLEENLRGQMKQPYFPVSMNDMSADTSFTVLKRSPLKLGTGTVSWMRRHHPGGCYAYCVEENGRRIVYSTDTELSEKDFERTEENRTMFEGADILIMDAQYTLGEAIEKHDWGHSSYSLAVDFAAEWGVKQLYLFHHDPLYDDNRLYGNLQSAQWYLTHLERKGPVIHLAQEGTEVDL